MKKKKKEIKVLFIPFTRCLSELLLGCRASGVGREHTLAQLPVAIQECVCVCVCLHPLHEGQERRTEPNEDDEDEEVKWGERATRSGKGFSACHVVSPSIR